MEEYTYRKKPTGLARIIEPLLSHLKPEQRDAALIGFVLFLIVSPFLIGKALDNRVDDPDIGYRITGPLFWQRTVSKDKRNITYEKYKDNRPGNVIIKLNIALDKPFNANAYEYIFDRLLPKVSRAYVKAGSQAGLREDPYLLERNGREWGLLRLYAGGRNQTFYVTISGDYTLILSLDSPPATDEKNRKTLSRTLDSMIIDAPAPRKPPEPPKPSKPSK